MLGYLASTSSCPRCDQDMSRIQGRPHGRHCTACAESFEVQFGYLVAEVDAIPPLPVPADIDLRVTIDLTPTIDLSVASEPA